MVPLRYKTASGQLASDSCCLFQRHTCSWALGSQDGCAYGSGSVPFSAVWTHVFSGASLRGIFPTICLDLCSVCLGAPPCADAGSRFLPRLYFCFTESCSGPTPFPGSCL